MNFLVALLGKVLGAKIAFEWLDVFMDKKMIFQATLSREFLATTFELAKQQLTRAFSTRIKHL